MKNSTNGSPAKLFAISMLCSQWIHLLRAWRTGQLPLLPSSTGNCCIFKCTFSIVRKQYFWESFTNALYFRCVLNWFGDWSTEALYQVGKEFTSKMDLEKPNYIVPDYMPVVYDKLPQPPSHREAIVNSCVFVHQTLHQVCFIILLNSCCSLFLSIMHQFSKTYGI